MGSISEFAAGEVVLGAEVQFSKVSHRRAQPSTKAPRSQKRGIRMCVRGLTGGVGCTAMLLQFLYFDCT